MLKNIRIFNPLYCRWIGFSISMLLIFCFSGCLTQSDSSLSDKYSFHLLDNENREYIVTSNSLDSGLIKPEESTTSLPDSISRNMVIKNGYYYHLQRKSGTFNQYKLINNQLSQVAQLRLKDYREENFIWIAKDTLLLTGLNHTLNIPKYYIVNTRNMSLISEGLLDIPRPSGKFNTSSIGFVLKKKDKLMIGYTFHTTTEPSVYTTSDTMYVATLNYPDMHLVHWEKETRSTYPGGVNTVQHNEFTDENGDFYFMSCPGIAMGNRPDLPTGIFRISANSLELDKDYFLNLSKEIGNHAYGFWNVGDGKAIVRAERKDLFKGLADHYSVDHFEYYLIDLRQQKVIEKLNLPLDKGTRKDAVIVKGDLVYIAVNSSTQGNYIWRYNVKTKALSKGLQFAGVAAFIVRMDVLHP